MLKKLYNTVKKYEKEIDLPYKVDYWEQIARRIE